MCGAIPFAETDETSTLVLVFAAELARISISQGVITKPGVEKSTI